MTYYKVNSYNKIGLTKLNKGGGTINRQTVYELINPCIDYQASLIRVFNAVPGVTIDIHINDVPRIVNLEYRELSQYMATRPGARNLKIYESQTENLLLEIEDFEIITGQIITDVVFGSPSDLKFVPIVDDVNETIMPDETKVRIYNLDATDIQFQIGSLNTTLASGTGTEYMQINPGAYPLEITVPNQRPKIINMNFNVGRIYTIYIIGNISPDSPNYSQLNIPQVILVVDGNTMFSKCM